MGQTTSRAKAEPYRPQNGDGYDGRAPGSYLAQMAPNVAKVIGEANLSADSNAYHASQLAKVFWCTANRPPPEYVGQGASEQQRFFHKYHETHCTGVSINSFFIGGEFEPNRELDYHLPKFWVRRTTHVSREIEYHWSPNDILMLSRTAHEDLAAVEAQRTADVDRWRTAGCDGDVPPLVSMERENA